LAVIEAAVAQAGTAAAIAESVTEVFVRRAVAGRRLAHALMFEEVPDAVQLERLILRRGYVAAVAAGLDRVRGQPQIVRTGVDAESPSVAGAAAARGVPAVPAEVAARSVGGGTAAHLGAVMEPRAPAPSDVDALVSAPPAFTRSAFTPASLSERHARRDPRHSHRRSGARPAYRVQPGP